MVLGSPFVYRVLIMSQVNTSVHNWLRGSVRATGNAARVQLFVAHASFNPLRDLTTDCLLAHICHCRRVRLDFLQLFAAVLDCQRGLAAMASALLMKMLGVGRAAERTGLDQGPLLVTKLVTHLLFAYEAVY